MAILIATPLLFVLLALLVSLGPFVGAVITYYTPKENYTRYFLWLQMFFFAGIVLTGSFFVAQRNILDLALLGILSFLIFLFTLRYFDQYKQAAYIFMAPILFFAVRFGQAELFAALIFLFGLFLGSEMRRDSLSTVVSDIAIRHALFLVTALLINLFSLGFTAVN